MTSSTVATDPSDDVTSTQKPTPYKYDLRLEIGVKEEGSTVPVVAIFYDFVKHLKAAADPDAPIVVLTATDKLFFDNKDMTPEEFQQAFKVDNIAGKNSKVLLGFKLNTLTKLSDLKSRMMHTYLIPHNLFLRQHAGGFAHGIKSLSYDFLKADHPDHPDISLLKQRYARITVDAWKKLDKESKQKWHHELPDVFYGNTGVIIPVNFTKERISATTSGKEKVTTSALIVSTPIKYGKLLKTLLDIALTGKRLNNLIPFALNKENSDGYYYMVAHQARFIENHRNIPVSQVPIDANAKPGTKGATLLDVLHSNPAVQRVAFDPEANRYHVSTTATKYRDVHQWLTQVLLDHRFPYSPQIKPLRYGNTGSTNTGMSYSDIFKDVLSRANESFASNPISTPPSNPWKTRPPLAISYSKNEEAFPSLPQVKPSVPSTPSTTSETIDEDTIRSAISAAIKKLEEQHREELRQLKIEMQSKIDEVATQMRNMAKQVATQTYQALVRDESPLATKTDHARLQNDISSITTQLSAMMAIMQNSTITPHQPPAPTQLKSVTTTTSNAAPGPVPRNLKRKPTLTPEKDIRPVELFTQECPDSSTTSSSVASMEGCEE